MNKKNNRKGFTITELVIVIAVIAILAAVLIPTFSSIITKANNSAALQEAKNLQTEYLANVDFTTETVPSTYYIKVVKGGTDYWFVVNNGALDDAVQEAPAAGTQYIEATDDSSIAPEIETVPAAQG